MDPNEREDSSRYVNEPREAVNEPRQERVAPVAPQPEPKRKKGKGGLILTLLLLLALAVAAVFGWLWYQQNGEVDSVRADLSRANNTIAQLESAAKAEAKLDDENATVTTDTTSDSSNDVITSALEYSKVRTGNRMYPDDPTKRQAKIDKQNSQFAKVTVTASGTPSPSEEVIYLKNGSDGWIVIGDDGEDIEQIETRFGLPKGF